MRFLTLTVKDDDSVKGYDFTSGEGDLSFSAVVEALEYALFGNDALFGGEIILTAEYEDNNYVLKRDFSRGTALVTLDGGLLSPEKTQLLLSNLAGVGQKQWRKNNEPTDYAAFLSDFSSYVEKYLSALGFTSEELEWRSEAYDRKNDRILAQVEVLDELVDENLSSRVEEKRKALRLLNEELASMAPSEDAGREDAVTQLSELEERLNALRNEAESYADKTAALEKSRRHANSDAILHRIDDLKSEMEELDAELSPLTAELDEKEHEIDEKKLAYEESKKEFDDYDARANALREEFFKMVEENKSTGEITAAVLEKTDAQDDEMMLKEFNNWNDKFNALAKELKETHVAFEKRRSIREGLAFETALEDMESELSLLNADIDEKDQLIKSIEEELKTDAPDGEADFVTLYRYKVLYDVYRSEISAEEKKIRENESARRKYSEDIAALEKASDGIRDCIRQCEEKIAELIDRITGVKTRISFCSDVDEMEYGDVCPVCKGRITDKADHALELTSLNVSLKKLESELDDNRTLLKEYEDKALSVGARLAQLKEKDRISSVFIDSLNASVERKQTEQNEMLSSVKAENYSDLERLCHNAAKSGGSGPDGLASIAFLKEKLSGLTEQKEANELKAKELKEKIDEMREAYETEILPPMDGNRAYSLIEEAVATESREDEIIAGLLDADSQRNIFLSYLMMSDSAAPRLVNATASVFVEIAEEIKRNDILRKDAIEKMQSCDEVIKALNDEFNEKIARADELLAKIEGDKLCIKELTELVGENNADTTVYSEEEAKAIEEDITEYYAKVRYLEERISEIKSALPEEDFDKEAYENKQSEIEVLAAELADAEKRLAVSTAAVDLACAKTEKCDVLIKNSEAVKRLADDDVVDVIMPIINDALYLSGESVTASADGLGIKFSTASKKGPKTVNPDDIDENVLHVAIDCALNYVLRLATDKETTRFLSVEKRGEEVLAATKYGVVLL